MKQRPICFSLIKLFVAAKGKPPETGGFCSIVQNFLNTYLELLNGGYRGDRQSSMRCL